MAEVRFPGGYTFDPETGELSGNGIPRSTRSGGGSRPSTRTYSSSAYSGHYGLSLWDRINNFFIGIGNWIAVNGERAMSYIALACLGLVWLGFVISMISVWMDEGFLWALIAAILGGGILYMVSGLALAVFYFIDDFVLLILRYIFYNVYTFLAVVVIAAGVGLARNIDFSTITSGWSQDAVQQQVVASDIYYCTASTYLNVRNSPSTSGVVVGSLKPGQEVEVYSFVNGFAQISYNGRTAYVSSAYLKQK